MGSANKFYKKAEIELLYAKLAGKTYEGVEYVGIQNWSLKIQKLLEDAGIIKATNYIVQVIWGNFYNEDVIAAGFQLVAQVEEKRKQMTETKESVIGAA